jgi:hypothetical protein
MIVLTDEFERAGKRRSVNELREFEEVSGEFEGFQIEEDHILVLMKHSHLVLLPRSASTTKVLQKMRKGDHVAILRIDNVTKVRRICTCIR